MAKKHGLPNVYPMYIDSIHGFALSKEGLLVAANCNSCHGSHHILSHNDPQSRTYKVNIPKTCGSCHAGITADYMGGVHGKAVAAGKLDAPVCSDCHTAHAILQPTEAEFRTQSTPICGSCHKEDVYKRQGRLRRAGDRTSGWLRLIRRRGRSRFADR